jgi:hypothetical protein
MISPTSTSSTNFSLVDGSESARKYNQGVAATDCWYGISPTIKARITRIVFRTVLMFFIEAVSPGWRLVSITDIGYNPETIPILQGVHGIE